MKIWSKVENMYRNYRMFITSVYLEEIEEILKQYVWKFIAIISISVADLFDNNWRYFAIAKF